MTIKYYINGKELFQNFGIKVTASSGVLSRPKRKKTFEHSYDDEHGSLVDLQGNYIESRDITLSCVLANSMLDEFIARTNDFELELSKSGLSELVIEFWEGEEEYANGHSNYITTLCYMVYVKDAIHSLYYGADCSNKEKRADV